MRTVLFVLMLVLAMSPSSPGGAAESSSDVSAIRYVIASQWDKPGAPVAVDPVVVVGGDAIAGWTQGTRGGRALLRRAEAGWKVVLCAGDALKQADALEQTGISQADAQALVAKLAMAEAALPPERVALFSTFQGLMQMDQEENPHAHR